MDVSKKRFVSCVNAKESSIYHMSEQNMHEIRKCPVESQTKEEGCSRPKLLDIGVDGIGCVSGIEAI